LRRFREHLSELFDRPYPYRMSKGAIGREGENIAVFTTGSSKDDVVEVELTFRMDKLYVNFIRGGRLDITGQGNASKILATVMHLVEEFVASAIVDEIVIIVEIGQGSGARQRIYRSLMNRHADRLGYKVYEWVKKGDAPSGADNLHFSLVRKDDIFA
jgi:hypothetical protein